MSRLTGTAGSIQENGTGIINANTLTVSACCAVRHNTNHGISLTKANTVF